MNLNLSNDAREGLTQRARSFIGSHCVRVDVRPREQQRQAWLEFGIPAEEIDRVVAFQRRWGGLVLPPYPCYEGGPSYLDPDVPVRSGDEDEGWWFAAGDQRCSVPFSFMIGPGGEFGLHSDRWTPLHETIEGWMESLALAHHAASWAKCITKVTGDEVEAIALDGYQPVREVRGLADTWWRGADSLVAIYNGEADCLSAPWSRTVLIYSGLDEWGLRGGVDDEG